jgi:hypothetical protein
LLILGEIIIKYLANNNWLLYNIALNINIVANENQW